VLLKALVSSLAISFVHGFWLYGAISFGRGRKRANLPPLEKAFVSNDYQLLYRVKELPNDYRVTATASPWHCQPRNLQFHWRDYSVVTIRSAKLGRNLEGFWIVLYRQGGFAPPTIVTYQIWDGTDFNSSRIHRPFYIHDMEILKEFIESGKAIIQKTKHQSQLTMQSRGLLCIGVGPSYGLIPLMNAGKRGWFEALEWYFRAWIAFLGVTRDGASQQTLHSRLRMAYHSSMPQEEFLLRFVRDRRRWLHWLFEGKKRFGTCILNYVVTSNQERLKFLMASILPMKMEF